MKFGRVWVALVLGCSSPAQANSSPSWLQDFPSLSPLGKRVAELSPEGRRRFLLGAQAQLFHQPEVLHLSDLRDVELLALFLVTLEHTKVAKELDAGAQQWFDVLGAYALWQLGKRFQEDEVFRFAFIDESWRSQLAAFEPLARQGEALGGRNFEAAILAFGRIQPLEIAQLRQLAQWSLRHEPEQAPVLLSRLLVEHPEHHLALDTCLALRRLEHPSVQARFERLRDELSRHYPGLHDSFERCERETTPFPQGMSEFERTLQQALRDGHWGKAEQLGWRWLQAEPKATQAWVHLGEIAYQRERWPMLRKVLEGAAQAQITHPRLDELKMLHGMMQVLPDQALFKDIPEAFKDIFRVRLALTQREAIDTLHQDLVAKKEPLSRRLAAFLQLGKGDVSQALVALKAPLKASPVEHARLGLDAAWLQLEVALSAMTPTQKHRELEVLKQNLAQLLPLVGPNTSALGAEHALVRMHLELMLADWTKTPLESVRLNAWLVESAPYRLALSAEKSPHLLSSLYALRGTLYWALEQPEMALKEWHLARAYAPPEVEVVLALVMSQVVLDPETTGLACRRVQEYPLASAWKAYVDLCQQPRLSAASRRGGLLLRNGGAKLALNVVHDAPLSVELDLRAGFYWLPQWLLSQDTPN